MKKLLLILLCFPFLVFSQNEKRLALVIGNANYHNGELKNPINDALLMSKTLDSLDFSVTLATNIADKKSFHETIVEFGNTINDDNDIVFLYYAGFGVQIDGLNYLLPTQEDFKSENDVMDNAINLQDILQYISPKSFATLFVFDACRDNPFEQKWTNSRSLRGNGLARPSVPVGSLIAFSTDAGYTVMDGDGENSIYCESLSKNLLNQNLSIDQVFRNVRKDVMLATENSQLPIEMSQLTGESIYLGSTVEKVEREEEIEETNELDEALEKIRNLEATIEKLKKGEDIDNYVDNERTISNGKYYALIISAQDYQDEDITDLDHPINDAKKLHSVLTKDYTFDSNNIKVIENATRSDILRELNHFMKIITDVDNFLIFYAGHAIYNERLKQGYWLPVDATKDSQDKWVSNSTILDYFRGITSQHTLLIADACFGGSLFKTRTAFSSNAVAMNEMHLLPSRKIMTSGAMTEVPDKSVFLEYLVKRLNTNKNRYLSSEELYISFKTAVIQNSTTYQLPQFGHVRESGDEGGTFIFIRK